MKATKRFSAAPSSPGDVSAALQAAVATAREFAQLSGLDAAAGARLVVVIDELVGNLLRHGAVADCDIEVALELARSGDGVLVTLEDNCVPFDPRLAAFAGPDAESGGGVGLALVGAWADILGYARDNGVNRLVLRLPREAVR